MTKRMLIINEDEMEREEGDRLRFAIKEAGKDAIESNISFTGGYNFIYANNQDGGNLKHFNRLENGKFDEKNWIKNMFYRPLADALVEKFEELNHISPGSILFLEDTYWKRPGTTPMKKCWKAQTKLSDSRFYAMTGYMYIMQFRTWFIEKMSREQVIACIYHELRHIGQDGALEKHEVEEWENLVATLGKDYANTRSEIINILAEDFDGWEKLRRTANNQIGMFDDKNVIQFAGSKK